jgi:hypothetical protein
LANKGTKLAFNQSKSEIRRRRKADIKALAELVYDVYSQHKQAELTKGQNYAKQSRKT